MIKPTTQSNEELKKELDQKIKTTYSSNQAVLTYFLQTLESFLYRYLETSTDKNIQAMEVAPLKFQAKSYESNMGDAFKISDVEIKEGIKTLAKNFPKEEKPKVQYELSVNFKELNPNHGKLIFEASVNWNYPTFAEELGKFKKKKISFEYDDIGVFRKELALKLEVVCALFL